MQCALNSLPIISPFCSLLSFSSLNVLRESILDWPVLRVALGLIGKYFATVSFDVVYTWSAEIYPTVVRYRMTLSIYTFKGLIIWEFSARAGISARLAGLKLAWNYMNVSIRAEMEDKDKWRQNWNILPQNLSHSQTGLAQREFSVPAGINCDYTRNLSPFKRARNPNPTSWRRAGKIISSNRKINFVER